MSKSVVSNVNSPKATSPNVNTPRQQAVEPHNTAYEQAVLASVLINPNGYDMAAQYIGTEHFFYLRHAYIWQAFGVQRSNNQSIDYIQTIAALEGLNRLNDVTETYLIQLLRLPVQSANVGTYAEAVMNLAVRRKLLMAAQTIGELAQSDASIDDIAQATQDVLALSQSDLDKVRLETAPQLVSQHYDSVEHAITTGGAGIVVPTGIATLDTFIGGGLERGKYHVFFAQPHLGKTATACSIALNACVSGLNVLFASTETRKQDVMNKLIAMSAALSPMQLSRGTLNETEHARYVDHAGRISGFNLAIDDSRPMTPRTIYQRIRTLQSMWGHVDLVIVDWLQQLHTSPASAARTYYEVVSEVSDNLNVTAERLDIALAVFAQEKRPERASKDKRPSIHRIEGSGQVGQDAAFAAGIYRHGFYEPHLPNKWRVEYTVQKNRLNGEYGTVYACMNPVSSYIHVPVMGSMCYDNDIDV